MTLANESISLASTDSGLQSELIEASRLLNIDRIVLGYCGAGAKELFRVDNPRHAVKLLDVVTGQLHRPTVLADALSLCEAFTHLSPVGASVSIIENGTLKGCEGCQLETLVTELFRHDALLAEQVVAATVALLEDLLPEACSMNSSGRMQEHTRKELTRFTTGVNKILSVTRSFIRSI